MLPVLCVEAVKPPGPVHEYVVMPAVAEKEVDPPEHMMLLPVMLHSGNGLTVSVLEQVLLQLFALVTVTVYVPAAVKPLMVAVEAVKPPGPVHE